MVARTSGCWHIAPMSGWLIKVTSPGLNPDTREIVEMWAAWVPNAVEAVAAVEEKSGLGDPPAETLCKISEELLRGVGLNGPGEVVRVRAFF